MAKVEKATTSENVDTKGQEKEREKEKKPAWISLIVAEDSSNYSQITYEVAENVNPENADKYLYEVRRYKDSVTLEEYLSIDVFEASRDGNDDIVKGSRCAKIERASIVELESKLLNLRVYGVIMARKHFPKIRQLIEMVYPTLAIRYVDESTIVTDNVIAAVYEMFVRYINEVGIEADKNKLYNIPVDEFKEYIADTKYNKYKYVDIRKGLATFQVNVNGKMTNGTKCSFGRNDNTIVKGDKRIKVISFVGEAVDSYQITKLPEELTQNEK